MERETAGMLRRHGSEPHDVQGVRSGEAHDAYMPHRGAAGDAGGERFRIGHGNCYVFRYLSRRTAFYPTVIRRDLENAFL